MTYDASASLTDTIRQAESGGARVGLVLSLDGRVLFGHRAEERFVSASVVKIAIMLETFRAVEAGRLALDQPIEVTADRMAKGSGVLHWLAPGYTLRLRDLLYLMMAISDNTATNLLIDLAGIAATNATMREQGMTASVLGRKMYGRLALESETENMATAADYDRLIWAIVSGRAAAGPSCAAMCDLLRGQQNDRRMARFLPVGSDWGSKTGTLAGVANDAGFLRGAAGTACLSMFTTGFAMTVEAEEALGAMARAAFRQAGVLA